MTKQAYKKTDRAQKQVFLTINQHVPEKLNIILNKEHSSFKSYVRTGIIHSKKALELELNGDTGAPP